MISLKRADISGVLNLYKEGGMTSQRAVSAVKRILGIPKAGHGGTLDPMAEGVLPILIGSATKFFSLMLADSKGYRAGFKLGVTTDTYDTDGRVTGGVFRPVSRHEIEDTLPAFRGAISQIPPMYSAVSKGGKRLYELARSGIEIEREPRMVTVYSALLTEYDDAAGEGILEISSSSGTYVRSIIRDIGETLGCGAVMTSLIRTAAAGLSVRGAVTLHRLSELAEVGEAATVIRPVEEFFTDLPELRPDDFYMTLMSNGQRIDQSKLGISLAEGEMARLYDPGGKFVGLALSEAGDGGNTVFLFRRV